MNSRENKDKVDKYNEGGRNRDIISDFHNYWCIVKRRWLPAVAVFGSVFALSALYALTKAPSYRAQGQLLFQQDKASSLIGLTSAAQQGNSQGSGWLDVDRILDTEIRVLLSEPILQRTLDVLNRNNLYGVSLNLDDLKSELAIKNATGTNLLVVSYQSKDPRVAALVLNQLMITYLDSNLLANHATAIAARQFIIGQLPKVKENVVSADTALRRFKEKYKIPNLDATKSALATNIERIQSQIDSAKTQLGDLNSQSLAIQEKLEMNPHEAMALSALSQSPAVQGLLANLQDVQRKLGDARSRYQQASPVLVGLQSQEVQARALLQNQVAQVLPGKKIGSNGLQIGPNQQALMTDLIKGEVVRTGLVEQMTTLANQKAFYLRQAAILPGLEQQQRELERDLLVAESTYEALLKNLQEVKIQENQAVGNVRIIEPALVPKKPIAANKASTMTVGGLSGIVLAGGVLYLLEARDKKIKTVQEARELFEYTVLGTIPVFSKKTRTAASDNHTSDQREAQLPVIDNPRSSISESYRRLQANLKFLNSAKALKVIVVTSSVPKEGKSTICANLAASMAQLGHRVLIVDADMHRPLQHQLWKISNVEGLSNIISEEANIKGNVFHRVMHNLDVLSSGVLPPNPLALIDSRRMATFLEECSNNYDYVFIDTPPLAFAADAATLGRMADGVVIVTRPGVADSTSSRLAKEYLDQSGQNVLGIVINGVLAENDPHNLHYYAQG